MRTSYAMSTVFRTGLYLEKCGLLYALRHAKTYAMSKAE